MYLFLNKYAKEYFFADVCFSYENKWCKSLVRGRERNPPTLQVRSEAIELRCVQQLQGKPRAVSEKIN